MRDKHEENGGASFIFCLPLFFLFRYTEKENGKGKGGKQVGVKIEV